MARLVSVILEVLQSGDGQGMWQRRAVQDLRESSFNGHRVLGVVSPPEGVGTVVAPHFGYSQSCSGGFCDHTDRRAVVRYFGYAVVLDVDPNGSDLNLLDESLRFRLSGYAQVDLVACVRPSADPHPREAL